MNIKIIFGLALTFMACSCGRAQLGVNTFDLAKIDYKLDVAYFYSTATDTHDPDYEGKPMKYFYDKDTLKYYNTQTDELYPCLIQYSNRGGGWNDEDKPEARFGKFEFHRLSMVTTMEGRLAMVRAHIILNETQAASLKKVLNDKYGPEPRFQTIDDFDRERPIWRWSTPTGFIQLELAPNDGRNTLRISITGEIEQPVKIDNPKPFIEGYLTVWKKEHNDAVLINKPLNMWMFTDDCEPFHAQSARWYTPEVVKPFLVTTHYLDSLSAANDVWSRILSSYYRRIPQNGITDKTGLTDSVKINREGGLSYLSFGPLAKNFKGKLTNAQYMVRLMRGGMRFSDLMTDRELCKPFCLVEVEWKDKKLMAGFAYLSFNGDGGLVVELDEINYYRTLYDLQLLINDDLKESFRQSGLDLERTTAQLVSLPIGIEGAYVTDGRLELFTPVMSEGGISIYGWYVGKLYPMVEVLESIKRGDQD